MSVNKVILVGNVGQDPEIRTTQDGREIANFSVATSESWKDKTTGERKDKTEWHQVVVFSQGLVGIVKNYVKKGSKLYIEGKIQTEEYTNKEGKKCYATKVVLQGYNAVLELLDKKEEQIDSHNKAKANGYQQQDDDQEENSDDIPF